MRLARKTLVVIVAGLTALALALSLRAQQPPERASRLGERCHDAAKPALHHGMRSLHDGAHALAILAFADAARHDRGCAMAHWGIAVATMGDPTSSGPTHAVRARGAIALANAARLAAYAPATERALVDAAIAYYEGSYGDHAARLLAYLHALERAPRDDLDVRRLEARVWQALGDF